LLQEVEKRREELERKQANHSKAVREHQQHMADEEQRIAKEQDELARHAQSRQAQLQREQEELERKERELAGQGKLNRDEQKKVHDERQRLEAERTKISEEKRMWEIDLQKQQQKLDQRKSEEEARLKSENKKIEDRKRELEKKERVVLAPPEHWTSLAGSTSKLSLVEVPRDAGVFDVLKELLNGTGIGDGGRDQQQPGSYSRLELAVQQGMNERFAGASAGTKFGDGSYFSDDAGKIDQYVVKDERYNAALPLHQQLYIDSSSRHPGSVFYAFVFRVTLGHSVRYDKREEKCFHASRKRWNEPLTVRSNTGRGNVPFNAVSTCS
jgi:hypothetical protein